MLSVPFQAFLKHRQDLLRDLSQVTSRWKARHNRALPGKTVFCQTEVVLDLLVFCLSTASHGDLLTC